MQITSTDENQSVSPEDFMRLLQPCTKFKERSFETSKSSQLPLLQSQTRGPSVVLLGDSMIERMQTTGKSPSFEPWPSEAILSDDVLDGLKRPIGSRITRLGDVFNAGVGGDKYENILYRLAGDSSPDQELPSLMEVLAQHDVKLWVIQAGTNNLHPKKGLSDASVDMLRLLLQTVLRVSKPEAKVLLTGLFYRTDVPDTRIDEANSKLESLVALMGANVGNARISFLPAPATVKKEIHLDDHVHLNDAGYRVWLEILFSKMLQELNQSKGGGDLGS